MILENVSIEMYNTKLEIESEFKQEEKTPKKDRMGRKRAFNKRSIIRR